ncbi:MAG: energy transducer TonB [Cyclobacteriaceae bacterium]|jgi:protein TonB|nr:energy transducer TonB [Cytophagales bacterium]MCZ8329425.1 energy transducer TonB [Cyclobacteriaceae bacterium]
MLILLTRIFLSCILIFFTIEYAYSYATNSPIQKDTVYSYADVDDKPFPGTGMESLYKKWNSTAKYPIQARANGVQGKVYVSFTVTENGDLIDLKVEQGIGYGCDEATIEALKKIDIKWKPGIKNGEKVKVRMFLPFTFKLQ